MDDITEDSLARFGEALPMMIIELIDLASSGKVGQANKTAGVIMGEMGDIIDFAAKVLEEMRDRSSL